MMKKLIAIIMTVGLFSGTAFSVELLKADFSGTPGGVGVNNLAIPAGDVQLTVDANVLNGTFNVLGGTVDTAQWAYSAGGDALLNADLYTASNWGAPTRMDLGMELAAPGMTYTITNVEVDVSATNATDVSMSLWYARDAAAAVRLHTPAVVIPAGTTGTFTIDTSLSHLIANDSDATWNQAGIGDLRLEFYSPNGTNVDSMAISEVRINGTTGTYVPPVVDTTTLWNFNTLGDTEGWTQDANAHITGLTASNGVLTAANISANDPQVVNYDLVEPAEGYWDSMVIRVRQLNTNGAPQEWSSAGCAVVLGDEIISSTLGGTGWEVTSEAGEWITASISISSLGTNQLDFLRFDPIGSPAGVDKSFEVDYVQLTSSATPSAPTLPDASNWEFNTDGDLEGWEQGGNGHITGLSVSNGVLFSQAITGNDPMLNGPAVVVGSYYWTTAKVRIRQTDTNGTGIAWAATGCSVLINGVSQPALGSSGWDVTTEAGEWIVATLDISSFESSDISNLRIDPVGQAAGTNKNFEVDYVRLNNQATPIPPQFEWEFNTDGDLEGWSGNQITNLFVTNGVMSATGVTGGDPKLNKAGPFDPKGFFWTTAEVRLRHLDSGGTPIAFNIGGLTAVIGGQVIQGNFWQITPEGSGEWVVARIGIAQFDDNTISGNLRLDPVGNDATKNFEVDYIRLNNSLAPLQKTLVQNWEFDTPGDTEGLTGNAGISGLIAATAYSGSESVLTCVNVTSGDPQVLLPSGAPIATDGTWDTLEFRARQLSGNGGPFQTWSVSGTIVLVNGNNRGAIPSANVIKTDETNGWATVRIDISFMGASDLKNFRIDVVGNNSDANFEIDWIRAYAKVAPVGYDAWTVLNGLSGGAAAPAADPDNDQFNNFYEYAFGGNPVDGMDIGLLPVASGANVGSSVLQVISFERSDPDSALDYSLEARNNLQFGSWADLIETVDYTVAGTGTYNAEMNAVTNHVPATANVRFIQSKATAE